jgi:hypothetical protein
VNEKTDKTVEERLAALEKAFGRTGLGAPGGGLARAAGICCPPGCSDDLACEVSELLSLRSARLALAVATANPLVPYSIRAQGTFTSTAQDIVTDVGTDVKVSQDTRIDEISYQVQVEQTPAGFDSLIQFFFQYVSGIEAKLKVVSGRAGGVGYEVVPNFTPISLIARKTPRWLITLAEGIIMDFQATIPLPAAPVTVTFDFKGRTSPLSRLTDVSNKEALQSLKELGWDCGMYEQLFCP